MYVFTVTCNSVYIAVQNRFTTARERGLSDYDLNDRTRSNEANLTVKHFNVSVAN